MYELAAAFTYSRASLDLDDDVKDEGVFYCPDCADREFHRVE